MRERLKRGRPRSGLCRKLLHEMTEDNVRRRRRVRNGKVYIERECRRCARRRHRDYRATKRTELEARGKSV